ncbi:MULTISPECIES: transporter [Asticcacaulis]|uniref:transporter n=1 Tax=Asticcacaulis TaxID=76890 RepID=UPI001AE5B866|nr:MULTISPECIES: transporter [Asticcacaulis]MBP2157854.1 hypothetical protein [Asticcacaulis solisilvae]MDR6798899.1 hypothetical protein [Asticcacaulis sp. BE141]
MTRHFTFRPSLLALTAGLGLISLASPAMADEADGKRLERIEQMMRQYEERLAAQEKRLAEQEARLKSQETELVALRSRTAAPQLAGSDPRTTREKLRDRVLAYTNGGSPEDPVLGSGSANAALATVRAGSGGYATALAGAMQVEPVTGNTPQRPVGEAPPPERKVEVTALPERVGVLTPRGKFVMTPSFEYVRSSSNRLVFRGVEIVPGIQLGVIEANDADRDSAVGAIGLRYGLTRRFEIEGRIPYVYRHDRVTTVAQRDETISRTIELDGQGAGDVEISARYQINEVRPGKPIFVANARYKPATGLGPYDVGYDEFGVAKELSTGSGFDAIEGGVTMLYPTDPAVIFASLSYLHNLPKDIDKEIGDAMIGRVEPGDSIGASLGFGLSLNPRFSVSFGYSHNYIFPTKTEIGSTWQESNSLQVGSILMGWSFRLTEKLTLSNNFQFGVTSDAPGMQAVFSLPVRF